MKPVVDTKKCKGCGACVSVCPVQIFELKAGKSAANPKKANDCLGCKACEASCPAGAIKVN